MKEKKFNNSLLTQHRTLKNMKPEKQGKTLLRVVFGNDSTGQGNDGEMVVLVMPDTDV